MSVSKFPALLTPEKATPSPEAFFDDDEAMPVADPIPPTPPGPTVDPSKFRDQDWIAIMWYLHTHNTIIRCNCGAMRRMMRDPCWNCGY